MAAHDQEPRRGARTSGKSRQQTACQGGRRALQFDDKAGVPGLFRLRSYPRNLSGSCQRREPMDGQTNSRVMPDKPKTAIIGGGVIGLAIGWRLVQAGCVVEIFE